MAVKVYGANGKIRDVPTGRRRVATTLVTASVREAASGEDVHRLKDALDRSDASIRRYRRKAKDAVA